MPSGCQNFPLNISMEPHCHRPPWSPCHRRVLPRASVPSSSHPGARSRPRSRPLRAPIFPNLSWSRRQPCRPCPQAYNAIPEPATMSSSPSPRRCAPHTIPEPTTPMTRINPRPIASSSSPSPRHLEPMMSLNPRRP
jgi:hypothetical protein